MNRRDFMWTSTAAMAGMSLAVRPRTLRAAPASANAIRVGLIGCGGRGTGAAVQALSTTQDVKLVAMADAFADRVKGCYDTLTAVERVETLAEALGDLGPGFAVFAFHAEKQNPSEIPAPGADLETLLQPEVDFP